MNQLLKRVLKNNSLSWMSKGLYIRIAVRYEGSGVIHLSRDEIYSLGGSSRAVTLSVENLRDENLLVYTLNAKESDMVLDERGYCIVGKPKANLGLKIFDKRTNNLRALGMAGSVAAHVMDGVYEVSAQRLYDMATDTRHMGRLAAKELVELGMIREKPKSHNYYLL